MIFSCFLVAALATLASAQISGTPPRDSCLCISGSGVNIRDSPCGESIGTGNTGNCYTYLNNNVNCILSGTTYTFYQLDYGANGGWVAGDFLDMGTATNCASGGSWEWREGTCALADIVTRSEWGARPPSCTLSTISNPTNYMFIHYSAGTACSTQAACTSVVQGIQDYHMDSNGWCDIGYSFLVGEDGRGYEGRGWRYVGAHTSGYNSVGHAICTMGDFMSNRPNDAAMMAVQHLIDCCLNQNYLVSSFKLNGHRDTEATSCPGDAYYVEIQTWPYYCFDAPSASNPGRTCTNRPLAKKAPLRLH